MRFNSIARQARLYLITALSLQLAFAPIDVAWAAQPPRSPSNTSDSGALDSTQQEWLQAADDVEQGRPLEFKDPFTLVGQYFVVYNADGSPRASYHLDQPNIDLPQVPFTSLKPRIDEQTGDLVIDAFVGADEKGEHGLKVASQFIPLINSQLHRDIRVVAVARDDELLSLVDSKGRIHVTDWGYASSQVFRSPIPVYQNIEEPSTAMDLSDTQVTAQYITRGVKPVDVDVMWNQAVLPKNAEGEVEFTAGDLLVRRSPDQVIGVYSRKVLHAFVARASRILELEVALTKKDPEELKTITETFEEQEHLYDDYQDQLKSIQPDSLHPIVQMALRGMGDAQITMLKSRAESHDQLQNRDRDWFYLDEWHASFDQIVASAQNESQPTEDELARNWKSLIEKTKAPEVQRPLRTRISKASSKGLSTLFAKATDMRYLASLAATYMIGSIAISRSPELQQIAALNWMYVHAVPAVLKDKFYQIPLLLSTASFVLAWPEALGVSALSAKALGVLNRLSQGRSSAFARKSRDLFRAWAPLGNWQRIQSFGMRFYAHLIYPATHTILEKGLRQKTLITALENNLNPFKKITPNSPEGQEAGLQRSLRLGVNSPFQRPSKLNTDSELRRSVQTQIVNKKNKAQERAWLLASLVVAEKYHIDLASLMILENKKSLSAEDVKKILDEKGAREDWELLTDELNRQLLQLPADLRDAELNKLTLDNIPAMYVLAKQTAQELEGLSKAKKTLRMLRIKALRRAIPLKNEILNLGLEQYRFLKSIYANKFVSQQGYREFISDHLQVTFLIALLGGRADLSHPENLAAQKDGLLWTSPQHWTDMGLNLYAHFFLAGATVALIYQKVEPKTETTYQPKEDISYEPNQEEQGFLRATSWWLKGLFNLPKSDMGGIMIRQLQRSARTVQAYILMAMAMRMSVGDQNLHDAAFGAGIAWLAMMWYFGWVWTPVQQGNKVYGEEIATINDQIVEARRQISWGLRQRDPQKAREALNKGFGQLFAMYKKYRPKLIKGYRDGIDTRSFEQKAQDILTLSLSDPPVEPLPNESIQTLTSVAASFASTLLAIPLTVMTYNPDALNFTTLVEWAGISTAAYTGVYYGLGSKPWQRYLKFFKGIKEKTKKKTKDALLTFCEKLLQ